MGFPSPQGIRHWLFFKKHSKKHDDPAHSPSNEILEKLAIESDGRLLGSLSSSGILGLGFVLALASLPVIHTIDSCPACVPDIVVNPPAKPDRPTVIILDPKKTKALLKRYARTPKPQGRPALTREPKAEAGVLAPKVIVSQQRDPGRTAYEILNAVTRDLPKLDGYAVIKREGATRYTGRPGRQSTAFNPEYDIKDLDGERNLADDLPSLQRIVAEPDVLPEMPRPSIGEHSIGVSHELGQRSTASILAVVKSRSPGLRHLYNQHLRQYPGLQGKVSVRFAIDARGLVVSAALEGSTTGYAVFDQAILQAVKSWRFEPVRHLGVEEVLVPLQFSE
jgi:TonB family protein